MSLRLFFTLLSFFVFNMYFSEAYATLKGGALPDLQADEEKKPGLNSSKGLKNANISDSKADKKPVTPPKQPKPKYVPKVKSQSPLPEQKNLTIALQKEEIVDLLPIPLTSKEDKEEILTPPSHPQNALAPQKELKKKKRKSKKSHSQNLEINQIEEGFSIQKSVIKLPKDSIENLILKVEKIIQKIMDEKHEHPLKVCVRLEKKNLAVFHTSFSKLVEKYPFPFSWSSTNKGPIDQKSDNSDWIVELRLSSLAKLRERVEKEFIYQIAQEEEEKIDWPLIYDLAMRSGFSLEDFKFNNSLKIRILELKGKNEEENLEEIRKFLETKLPRDNNPFHIVGFKVNKASGVTPSQLLNSFLKNMSYIFNNSLFDRGMIQDPKSSYFYLCMDNDNRMILDLHGKKDKSTGGYDGRNVKQAREETISFIKQAYELFQDEVTVLTGRGNHVSNGQQGVLYEAFKEWAKDPLITSLIKKYFPLEGNGGYKILFIKPRKLDLSAKSTEEAIPLIKQTISEIIHQGQFRLHLKMTAEKSRSPGNKEYLLMTHLAKHLTSNYPELFKSISPVSFYTKPGELRFIFNQRHPRYPDSMSWGNCFGNAINEGTIGLHKDQ